MERGRIRKFGRYLLFGVGALLLMPMLLYLSIQIPTVQNVVVHKLTGFLSKKLDAEVSVDQVKIKLFKTASLDGIYLEDLNGDTLLHISELDIDLGLFNLFRKEIEIDHLALRNSKINLKRLQGDSTFNYEFILDAFSKNDQDTSRSAWKLGIGKVELDDLFFSQLDEIDSSHLVADLVRLRVYVDEINLPERKLALNQIGGSGTMIKYEYWSEVPAVDTLSQRAAPARFPGTSWDIALKQLRLEDGGFVFAQRHADRNEEHVDFRNLDLDIGHLFLDELVWSAEQLDVVLRRASLTDHSGFAIKNVKATLYINPEMLHINDFQAETPYSAIESNTALDFNSFSDLSQFSDSVYITAYFDDAQIGLADLNYLLPVLQEQRFFNNKLKEIIRIDGGVKGTLSELNIDHLKIEVPNHLNLAANGQVTDLTGEQIDFDIALTDFSTSYDALRSLTKDVALPEGIAPWGDFDLTGDFKGSINDLYGRDIQLKTSGVTGFIGDFRIRGLPMVDQAVFDLEVDALRSISQDLDGFVDGGMPDAVDSLGAFFFRGDFHGTFREFTVAGDFISEAGDVSTNFDIKFAPDYTDAIYSGDISTDSFDLGKILADEHVGFLSMDVYSYGQGLNESNLKTVVIGDVEHLDLLGYAYEGLELDGRFDKKQFSGHAEISDENIDFDFEGVISLSDSISKFRFKSRVDTINFKALNLLDTELGLSARLRSDFRGPDLYSMDGGIKATGLSLSNLTHSYRIDALDITAEMVPGEGREIKIESDILDGFIKGDFTIGDLPSMMKSYVNNYFPINGIDSVVVATDSLFSEQEDTILPDQSFAFELSLINTQPVIALVALDLQVLDTVLLSGGMNASTREMSLDGYLGRLEYGSISLGPINLRSRGDEHMLDNVLEVKDTRLSGDIHFPYLYADALLENDSAYFSILLEGDRDSFPEKLGLAALLVREQDLYSATLNDVITLNNKTWQVNPQNRIQFKDNYLSISDLTMSHSDQVIKFFSKDRVEDKDYTPIGVYFEDFRVREISDFLDLQDATYDGDLNGELVLQDVTRKVSYLADLAVKDLTFQDELVGDLTISSEQKSEQRIDLMVKLEGGISGVDLRGTYNPQSSAIDIQGEVDRLRLKNLDPFFRDYIEQSEGEISGLIDIQGTTKLPQINGSIELENVSTIIDYLQGRYTLDNEELEIRQNEILFEDFTLTDPEDQSAKINGKIVIESVDEYSLSLKATTDKFTILNTSLKDNDLFYGKLVVRANVDISGTSAKPILDMNVRTLTGTDLAIRPLSYEASFQQEDFIIFANPDDYMLDTTVSIQDLYKLSEYGIELTANLELTPSAKLTIVVDPTTGDKLVCRGSANLTVDVTPQGNLSILGNYSITEGQYAFNFQRVLKRTFEIEPGSTVSFIGDPLKSRFDITARYSVSTTTYELIRNQSTLSPAEESRSRQRRQVFVKLDLEGNLEDPEAKFDIVLSENSGAGVTSSVSSKLLQLREDESSMNKQVFGLLIFNSFIAEEQSVGAASLIADAGQSAILTSVSNLLSNELNRLAKRYIKGVDLDFGVGSYSSAFDDENSLITELQVGLSKSLLNDRLTVKLGGNVQFDNSSREDLAANQNSTFSGDFVLEYKLTGDGDYRLRFFQSLSNEENLFEAGTNYSETGVSVFFTRSFNSKKYQLQIEEGSKSE
ncbi:MAG: AsmA family protein [Saprospiraceae bacterium]|nr:AsmA family protein [Saprospiraceae bacterium]